MEKKEIKKYDKKSLESYSLDSYIKELQDLSSKLKADKFDTSKTFIKILGTNLELTSSRPFSKEELYQLELKKINEKISSLKQLKDQYQIIINNKQESINTYIQSVKNSKLNNHDTLRQKDKLHRMVERLDNYLLTIQNIDNFLDRYNDDQKNLSLAEITKFIDTISSFINQK